MLKQRKLQLVKRVMDIAIYFCFSNLVSGGFFWDCTVVIVEVHRGCHNNHWKSEGSHSVKQFRIYDRVQVKQSRLQLGHKWRRYWGNLKQQFSASLVVPSVWLAVHGGNQDCMQSHTDESIKSLSTIWKSLHLSLMASSKFSIIAPGNWKWGNP